MFKSATFKLTVSYLVVLMVISIVFSAVVYRVGSDNLVYGLSRETQELSTAFPIFNGTQFAQPNPHDLAAARNHLLDELILTNLLVLVGGGLISYILARETLKPIEDTHEQQKRFVADVSHELRTPLTAIRMESEVALMDETMPEIELRKVIASNIEEASKLEALINNLMKLSRMEAQKLQQSFSEINLKQIAQDSITQVKPLAERHKIQLNYKGSSVKINGDPDSIAQMIVIFLDNAIKYSPNGSVVNIYSGIHAGQPYVKVTDHGKGIAANELEHVFDRFYRADAARSGKGGYGLGLSIAKMIADVHRANITITSTLGKGTSVNVSFEKLA
ncbi:HAMP domain-containing histidine kinase [Patescibacteria group bacterium]|nr:HAMP domain-containing histidine kinase [Patescibacteria group bacterium]